MCRVLKLLCLVSLCLLPGTPLWGATLTPAPMNPAFVEYQQQTMKAATSGETPYPTGRTPSPVDLSHLAGQSIVPDTKLKASDTFPASYDLRELGFVNPVRDQKPYGDCWTFSAMASMESTAMKRLGAESVDLSEWELTYYAYIDESAELVGFGDYTASQFPDTVANSGGDDFQATALLSRWTGAALETDVPFDSDPFPSGAAPAYHLSDVMFLYYDTSSRYAPVSIENLKYALVTYGAVSVGVFADNGWSSEEYSTSYFNLTTSSAYIPANNPAELEVGCANHAVTIVGWDDNYSRENFATEPEQDGAWIVRNSWGSDWGDRGYFYLSYADAVLDTGAAYISAPSDNYDNIYQYDPLGLCNMFGIPYDATPTTAWISNVFVSEGLQTLKAVSFYTPTVNTEYEISVFTDVEDDPTSGNLALYPQTGTLNEPGYRTVTLENPVYLTAAQTFSIVVKLTTTGYDFPIAIEYKLEGYSDKATANPGESFFSENGVSWTDTTTRGPTENICLKAFTDDITLIPAGGDLPPLDEDGAPAAFESFREDLNEISGDILDNLGADLLAGSLTVSGEAPLEYRSGNSVLNSGKTALDVSYDRRLSYNGDPVNGIILAAYNHQAGRYEIPDETGISDAAAATLAEVSLADGGPFDADGEVNGTLTDLQLMEVLVEAEVAPTSSGGGGCNLETLAPAVLLLLVPLALLKKR